MTTTNDGAGERGPGSGDDVELVRSAIAGDPDARRSLVERAECARSMIASRNARLGSPLGESELEDVFQETVLAMWSKLDRFGYGSLEAWLYRISTLELLSRLRKLRRRPALIEDVGAAPPEETTPGPDLQLFEVERVYRGLDTLGPPESDVIRMKLLEDITFEEAAQRLGEPTNTVKARYYRGLRKLRGILSREEGGRSGAVPTGSDG